MSDLPSAALDGAINDRVVLSLLFSRAVDATQVAAALEARQPDVALWRTLADVDGVDADRIFAEAARTYSFPTVDLSPERIALFVDSVRGAFEDDVWRGMAEHGVIPVSRTTSAHSGRLLWTFGTHDPARSETARFVEELELPQSELAYLPREVVRSLMPSIGPGRNKYLDQFRSGGIRTELSDRGDTLIEVDEQELESQIQQSALLSLFEAMLIEGVRQGASDIHLRPNSEGHLAIRFRVDGRLRVWHVEEQAHPEALLAVVKDNAKGVDRFERDAAQDGFIQRTIDGTLIRFRVSIIPVAGNDQRLRLESIVIRILDDRSVIGDIAQLGLGPAARARFENAIRQPYGLVILTGPTGSGKTTTLYAALQQLVSPEVNVISVEDPVEYFLPGVAQAKLSHKLGLEDALRAVLRHDPDVVMVGEMRDRPTAELGMKLANTGHLTFSTLHTNDAASAVSRLFKMGIEPFLVAHSTNLIVAQRLVRKLCPDCKTRTTPDAAVLDAMGFAPDARPEAVFAPGARRSCETCGGTGYRGRRAIAEALEVTPAIRAAILHAGDHIDDDAVRRQAIAEGMVPLSEVARDLVREGATSLDELRRVLYVG